MKGNKLVSSRSSYLVSWPVLGALAAGGLLAGFWKAGYLAAVLLFLALMGVLSRLWAVASARRVSIRVRSNVRGLFPGEQVDFSITLKNEKLLPVLWMEVFFPLNPDLCLLPRDNRPPEEWEKPALKEAGCSQELVGERRFSLFLWNESQTFSSQWTGQRRGLYSTRGWRLRTGDGFGLTQVEVPIPGEDMREIAVYPRLIPVLPDLFLRNLWNADTGAKGVMEDPTVIRSTRGYLTSDSVKHINWRLAARGLPLTVNVYEDILPRSVHFILDGESFSGPEPHLEDLEDALSVLGSELVRLGDTQVQCGLSLPGGQGCQAVNLFAGADAEEQLWALAGYQVRERKKNDRGIVPHQVPAFDEGPILENAQRVGRFYYLAYDKSLLPHRSLFQALDPNSVTLLTYADCGEYGSYETICLSALKGGERDG